MGKGLSQLQKDILAVLEGWPSFEDVEPGSVAAWALPRDIIAALRRPKTPATRVAISKALARLHARGAVAKASGELAMVGKSFRYVRITNSQNARAGNHGPLQISGRPAKMRTVNRTAQAKAAPRGLANR